MLIWEASSELVAQSLRFAQTLEGGNTSKPAARTAPSRLVRKCGGAIALALLVGTGGAATSDYVTIRDGKGYRHNDIKYSEAPFKPSNRQTPRSPAEEITYVRETLKPPVTELAQLFGVSRQAIYNWQAGEALAEQNKTLLRELVLAASLIEESSLPNPSSLIKRKLASGKTVLELLKDGESGESAAGALISMLAKESEQRERLEARLKNRNRPKVDLADAGAPFAGERT